jgi:diguanylate cyclase (GGDEF)-like protein
LLRLGALLAGVALLAVGLGVGILRGRADRQSLDRRLADEAHTRLDAIHDEFVRARDVLLLSAQNPAFVEFYEQLSGTRDEKLKAGSFQLDEVNSALAYLVHLHPDSIAEVSFIDANGAENARVVRGVQATPADLSLNETGSSFFAPTIALGQGQVYQAQPHLSPDSNDWVVSSSTVIPGPVGANRAILHVEATLRSLASLPQAALEGIAYLIVDADTGAVISDSRDPQRFSAPLGDPGNRSFVDLVASRVDSGVSTFGNRRAAFERMKNTTTNANDWYIVASGPALAAGLADNFGPSTLIPMAAGLIMIAFALASFRGYQHWLKVAALSDPLTRLPNRNMFADRVQQALLANKRSGADLAVLVLDLDRFKEINDTLGHHCGDELLMAIGPRIQTALRQSDTVARLGGDEFAILLPTVEGPSHALEVAQRILACLREPFVVGELSLDIEASIGIAVAPFHGEDFNELLQHADIAMYVAKNSHVGASLYDTALDTYNPARLSMLGELRRAIEEDELELYYQPKITLANQKLYGVEALLRWNHPQRGLVMPDEFIPFAEHTALIGPLTDWVINQAMADVRRWLDHGREVIVSVNVSTHSLLDQRLCDTVREILERHSVPSRLLMIEITETAIMTDPAQAREVLVALDALGVELSIDDFGTGYSSLAYLRTLPVHELKIDRSFVMNMCSQTGDAVIVRSVIDLGRNLGLRVIAEGVEDVDARDQLLANGCEIGQGYLWSRPVPRVGIEAMLDLQPVATPS